MAIDLCAQLENILHTNKRLSLSDVDLSYGTLFHVHYIGQTSLGTPTSYTPSHLGIYTVVYNLVHVLSSLHSVDCTSIWIWPTHLSSRFRNWRSDPYLRTLLPALDGGVNGAPRHLSVTQRFGIRVCTIVRNIRSIMLTSSSVFLWLLLFCFFYSLNMVLSRCVRCVVTE